MARIRTIKPEFFTSEDIVSLTPLARVFYIALWCESDREGRMDWKPGTLKMRYLGGDDCDVNTLAEELVSVGLIVIYEVDGKRYAEIPTFKNHQIINNREADSNRPARVLHASARVKAEGRKEGKEGKGKEWEGRVNDTPAAEAAPTTSKKGARLVDNWQLPKAWGEWAMAEYPAWTAEIVRLEAAKFADHWHAKAGKDGAKLDWEATWRNWCRSPICQEAHAGRPSFAQQAADVARSTVPGKPGKHPALLQIEEDMGRGAPVPENVRKQLERLKGGVLQ